MLPENNGSSDLSRKRMDVNSVNSYQIPSEYLNSFGFIDYKHNGSLPWTKDDKDIFLSAEYVSVTDYLAIDCEMVAVGSLKKSALGRVSIVNEYGYCIYDTFVNPMETITDYGTQYSGIRPEDLIGAPWSDSVVQQVGCIVKGKVLVGHSIHNDLEVLELNDHTDIRDTAIFFKNRSGNRNPPSLKKLTAEYFNIAIQSGEHSSIQDAQATLKLYLLFQEEWEKDAFERRKKANLDDKIADISCMHVEPRQPDLLANNKPVFVRPNKVVGAYFSSEEYRDIQFRLLLEDVLRPLRQDVRMVKQQMKMENHFRNIRISQGSASEETSFEVRSSKTLIVPIGQNGLQDVDWDDRNIFINGSLLLLSPDNFQSFKCAKVLDVAVSKRNDAPLRIFVHFLLDGPNWTITDRHCFQMIESQAFFLPYEYTLNFLQLVDFDTYPMKKYIVDAVTKSEIAPALLNGSNQINLSVLMDETNEHTKSCVNPLEYQNWPNAKQLNLDPSQFEALQKAITQDLTIIQGPPGTGKTHISLQIVKLILTNRWLNKSPLLIVSYTNHALDQLLEPIFEFLTDKIHGGSKKKAEQALLRFGGGCKSDSIVPCTVTYKIQKFKEKNGLKNQIKSLEKALHKVKDLNFKTKLIDQGILNFQMVPQIMLTKLATSEKTKGIFDLWTKSSKDINKNVLAWFGLDKTSLNLRKSTSISDGLYLLLCNNLANILDTKFPNIPLTVEELKRRPLSNQNPQKQYLARWGHYLFLIDQLAEIIVSTRNELILANAASNEVKDYVKYDTALKQANIIAMTTTGAVKFKKILENTLKPKIMLVEEAAHVLEAYVVASLTRHCTQLILIGDHKQLRPMIADHNLKEENLDVSLMERLVKNGINQNTQNWTQLKVQHRMRPEIARLICPIIYQELENHTDVEQYANVRGCSKNLFFIHHEHAESRIERMEAYHNIEDATTTVFQSCRALKQPSILLVNKLLCLTCRRIRELNFQHIETRSMSRFNNYEAQYIIGLLSYFTDICGYLQSQITVICTYLAQKTLIENSLKENPNLNKVQISTVDGYQGKQNDIILLSLVRNNKVKNVGFLKTDNRVCVALSRARHGLFMIGNMSILASSSDTWSKINKVLVENQSIGSDLPLHYPHTFKSHNTLVPSPSTSLQPKKSKQSRVGRRRSGGRGREKHIKQSSDQSSEKYLTSTYKSSNSSNMNNKFQKIQCNKSLENEKAASVLTSGQTMNISGVQRTNNVGRLETPNTKLQRGHEKLAYSQQPLTSQTNPKKIEKLPCGHKKLLFDSIAGTLLCNVRVTKTLKCGHSATHPCGHSWSKLECLVNISKQLLCGHKKIMPCNQKGEQEKSKIKCLTYVNHKLPCGHIHRFPCSENIKKVKCGSLIKRELPCGHIRDTACHQNPKLIKCRKMVAFNGMKRKIECCNFVEIVLGTLTDALKSTRLQ